MLNSLLLGSFKVKRFKIVHCLHTLFKSQGSLQTRGYAINEVRKELKDLDKTVLAYDKLYYNLLTPEITDTEYDKLVARMEDIGTVLIKSSFKY